MDKLVTSHPSQQSKRHGNETDLEVRAFVFDVAAELSSPTVTTNMEACFVMFLRLATLLGLMLQDKCQDGRKAWHFQRGRSTHLNKDNQTIKTFVVKVFFATFPPSITATTTPQ
jgi:hypothetical protein